MTQKNNFNGILEEDIQVNPKKKNTLKVARPEASGHFSLKMSTKTLSLSSGMRNSRLPKKKNFTDA